MVPGRISGVPIFQPRRRCKRRSNLAQGAARPTVPGMGSIGSVVAQRLAVEDCCFGVEVVYPGPPTRGGWECCRIPVPGSAPKNRMTLLTPYDSLGSISAK